MPNSVRPAAVRGFCLGSDFFPISDDATPVADTCNDVVSLVWRKPPRTGFGCAAPFVATMGFQPAASANGQTALFAEPPNALCNLKARSVDTEHLPAGAGRQRAWSKQDRLGRIQIRVDDAKRQIRL